MNTNEKLTKLSALQLLAMRLKEQIEALDLDSYVAKEVGKGLSSNDYTDEDKEMLHGLEVATDDEVTAILDEVFGGTEEEMS